MVKGYRFSNSGLKAGTAAGPTVSVKSFLTKNNRSFPNPIVAPAIEMF